MCSGAVVENDVMINLYKLQPGREIAAKTAAKPLLLQKF